MSKLKSFALALALTSSAYAVVTLPAAAQAETAITASASQASGDFVRKSKRLKGGWTIEARGDRHVLVLDDSFRAANGPDLKIFLSPQTLDEVTGKTAINGAINIGELKKTRGAQEYELPQGLDLADYQSVLVHCEKFAVLWGGGAL